MSEEVPPPWVAFPDLPRGSMGWRMGAGEEALMRFAEYVRGLPLEEARQLQERYPEPEAWQGFLDGMLGSRTDG